jgi:hypothetical protein
MMLEGRLDGELCDHHGGEEDRRYRDHQAKQRLRPGAPGGHARRRAKAQASYDVMVEPGGQETADQEGREQAAQHPR